MAAGKESIGKWKMDRKTRLVIVDPFLPGFSCWTEKMQLQSHLSPKWVEESHGVNTKQ